MPNCTARGNTSSAACKAQKSVARLRAAHVSGVRRDAVRTLGLRGEIFGHGRTKPAVESTRVFRRRQPSRDVVSMRALVGPSGGRIVQIFHRYAPATFECSRGYRGGEHPRASALNTWILRKLAHESGAHVLHSVSRPAHSTSIRGRRRRYRRRNPWVKPGVTRHRDLVRRDAWLTPRGHTPQGAVVARKGRRLRPSSVRMNRPGSARSCVSLQKSLSNVRLHISSRSAPRKRWLPRVNGGLVEEVHSDQMARWHLR